MQLKRLIPQIECLSLWDKANGKYIPFKLWPRQIEFMEELYREKKLIVLKRRQIGLSQLNGADSLVQCLFQNNFTVLILSITSDDARVFLNRTRDMYNMIPTLESAEDIEDMPEALRDLIMMKHLNPVTKGIEGGDEMRFKSGSSLVSLSARKGRGMTADRCVLDEAAFITLKNAHTTLDEVLKGIMPTLERADGQLVIISTGNGMNLFHDYYNKAKYGLSSFKPFFFSCWDDPSFSQKSREQKVIDHGEDYTNQEFPRTDDESFLSSGSPRFNINALKEYQEKRLLVPIFEGDIIEHGNIWRMVRSTKPFVRQFKKRDPRGQYLLSIDVAEGLEKGDFSIIKVFDMETLEQVLEWHGHCEHMELGKIAVRLGRIFNNALIVPEANNHGASTITQIRNEKYPLQKLFVGRFLKVKPDDDYKEPGKRYGWFTTSKTKKAIINNLAYMLDNSLIPGLSAEDISECMSYIIDSKGGFNSEEGSFDDRVIALGIGLYLLTLDSFSVHYPLVKHFKHQGCENCKSNKKRKGYEGKAVGRCGLSDRNTHDDDICSLYVNGRLKFKA